MQGRTALIAAIACGALAVALVGVDLQYGLEIRLEAMQDGEWVTVSSTDEEARYSRPLPSCLGQDFRLVVVNDRLAKSEVDVDINYFDQFRNNVQVLSESWSIPAGESQSFEFSVPDEAFSDSGANGSASDPSTPDKVVMQTPWISINVYIDTVLGEQYLYGEACQKEANA